MKAKYLVGLIILGLSVGVFAAQGKGQPTQEENQPAQEPTPGDSATAPAEPAGPHVFTISAQDAARKNPVKFTDVSVERGKKIYTTQCAMCHGEKGDGKGDIVEEMGIKPPDFTKPETLKDRTDGDLFAIIGQGSQVMPGQAKRLSDRHRWQIVNYLRSLAGAKPDRAKGNVPEENVILIPQ